MTADFLPCPYCGRKLTTGDLRFFDADSYLGDMEMVHDFDRILDPSNSSIPEDWKGMDEDDRQRVGKIYQETVEAVEDIQLHCTCGASVTVDRWRTSYPEEGWLEEFEDEVNARSMLALIATLYRYAEETTGEEPLHEDLVKARDAVVKARDTWRDHAFEVVSQ